MRVHQELEQLFKFRISSNDEIVPYLVRMSKLGKIDEPKRAAMLTLIIDRLGRIEDEQESFESSIRSEVRAIGTRADEEPTNKEVAEKVITKMEASPKLTEESDEVEEIIETAFPVVKKQSISSISSMSGNDIVIGDAVLLDDKGEIESFLCNQCDTKAKTKAGLKAHQRSHKPQE